MQVDPSTGDSLVEAVAAIVHALAPVAILLFGSHATERAGRESDYDLAVLMAGHAAGWQDIKTLACELEDMLGAPVDLVVLNDASPIVAMQVLREGKLLDCADPQALENFTVRALTDYADLKITRREAENRLMELRRS